MAYVIPWNNTTPAGSELASTADDYFRNTKFAIDERMTGFLVVDWQDDPLVLLPAVSGAATARPLVIARNFKLYSGTSITLEEDDNRTRLSTGGVPQTVQFGQFFAIPVGYELEQVLIYADRNGETVTLNVVQVNMTTGVETVLGSQGLAGAGIQATSVAALATTIVALVQYGIRITWTAPGTIYIYGIQIFINKTDNSQGY